MKLIRSVLNSLALIAGFFIFALVIDQIKPIRQLDAYLRVHPQPYTAIVLTLLVAGGTLWAGAMLVAMLVAMISRSQPMSDEEAKEFMSRRARWQVGSFRGKAVGREARLGASFYEVKKAFRSEAWLRDPAWWSICIGGIGVLFVFLGAFGYFFIIGAPTVKVMLSAAMAYAIGRTTWGFAIA